MTEQSVEGEQNKVAGRDINSPVTNNNFYGMDSVGFSHDKFRLVDEEVKVSLGKVSITTSVAADFSSEKLFISLINIGVPPVVSFVIATNIVPYVQDAQQKDSKEFSTAHIRRAVTRAILHMHELTLPRSQRQDLSAKYARNYGNPNHINMIIFEDGTAQPITYRYVQDTFLPKLLGHLAGKMYETDKIISRSNYEYMATEVIECVRRLGIYHVRYATIFALSEDLATQLPHPWVIFQSNRLATIAHDLERSSHHLGVLSDQTASEMEYWRSAYECFNHICSLILSIYTFPIGGGTHAAVNTLRNVTRLRASGIHQNLALWEVCGISELEDDLGELNYSMDEFHSELKILQKAIDRMRPDKIEFVRLKLVHFFSVASSLLPS